MFSAAADTFNRTVLVVDDTDTCTDLLEVALICIPGVDVACVPFGREALKRLGASGPQVCLMVTDLNMPHVESFDLIARVPRDAGHAALFSNVVCGDVQPRTPD